MIQNQRSGESEHDAECSEPAAAQQYHAEDVAWLRAERQANADFPGALRDGVSHDAVDADRGQRQRETRENAEQQHAEARAGQGAREQLLHAGDFGYRLVGQERVNLIANHAGGCERVAGGAYREYRSTPTFIVILRVGGVDRGEGWAIDRLVFHVRDDADNRSPGWEGVRFAKFRRYESQWRTHPNQLADWIFIREELVRKGFIDDGDARRGLAVILGEEAAVAEAGSDSGQKSGGAQLKANDGNVVERGGRRVALNVDVFAPAHAKAERQRGGYAGTLNAGKGVDALGKIAIKLDGGVLVAVGEISVGRELHLHGEHVVGGKARIGVTKSAERFNQEPRAGEQQDRHGDFGNYKQAAQFSGAAMFEAAAAAFAQSFLDVAFRCEERRRQREKQGGKQGNGSREG